MRGASAPEGMIPSYPSVTFSNHCTIVTGLYPEHTGSSPTIFTIPRGKSNIATWTRNVSGTAVGTAARRSGCSRSSKECVPLAFSGRLQKRKFRASTPAIICIMTRISGRKTCGTDSGLAAASAREKAAFYYPVFFRCGPLRPPLWARCPRNGEAVRHLDEMIGKLADGMESTHLPVDLIVVADHGMEKTERDWVTLDQFADLSQMDRLDVAVRKFRGGSRESVRVLARRERRF